MNHGFFSGQKRPAQASNGNSSSSRPKVKIGKISAEQSSSSPAGTSEKTQHSKANKIAVGGFGAVPNLNSSSDYGCISKKQEGKSSSSLMSTKRDINPFAINDINFVAPNKKDVSKTKVAMRNSTMQESLSFAVSKQGLGLTKSNANNNSSAPASSSSRVDNGNGKSKGNKPAPSRLGIASNKNGTSSAKALDDSITAEKSTSSSSKAPVKASTRQEPTHRVRAKTTVVAATKPNNSKSVPTSIFAVDRHLKADMCGKSAGEKRDREPQSQASSKPASRKGEPREKKSASGGAQHSASSNSNSSLVNGSLPPPMIFFDLDEIDDLELEIAPPKLDGGQEGLEDAAKTETETETEAETEAETETGVGIETQSGIGSIGDSTSLANTVGQVSNASGGGNTSVSADNDVQAAFTKPSSLPSNVAGGPSNPLFREQDAEVEVQPEAETEAEGWDQVTYEDDIFTFRASAQADEAAQGSASPAVVPSDSAAAARGQRGGEEEAGKERDWQTSAKEIAASLGAARASAVTKSLESQGFLRFGQKATEAPRQELAGFNRDARAFSHMPFRPSLVRHIQKQRSQWAAKLRQTHGFQLSRVKYCDAQQVHARDGVTAISFAHECDPDTYGLFAVGGTNGVVSVYDFDECLAKHNSEHRPAPVDRRSPAHEHAEDVVKPLVSVNARSSVACVRWLAGCPSQLVVALEFRAELLVHDIYALQDSREPVRVLRSSREPSRTAGSNSTKQGGYKSLLAFQCLPSRRSKAGTSEARTATGKQKKEKMEEKEPEMLEYVLAGASSGIIRCWQVKSQGASVPPVWELPATKGAGAVTGMAVLESPKRRERLLISATESGIVCVWDLVRLSTPSFGAVACPVLVKKIELSFVGKKGAFVDRVSGISAAPAPGVGTSGHGSHLPAPLVEGDPAALLVTCRSGSVHTLQLELIRPPSTANVRDSQNKQPQQNSNVTSKALVELQEHPSELTHWQAKPKNERELSTLSQQERVQSIQEANTPFLAAHEQPFLPPPCIVLPQPRVYDSDASVAAATGAMRQLGLGQASAVVCSSFPHNLPGAHYIQAKNMAVSTQAHSGSGLSRPRPPPQQPLPAVDLVKSPNLDVTLTLPARVTSATPGEQVVFVSGDLRGFLCGSLGVEAYPSRSDHLLVDWTHQLSSPLQFLAKGDSNGDDRSRKGMTAALHTLSRVEAGFVTLAEPYRGPAVVDGVPFVRLRTSLVPAGSKILRTAAVRLHRAATNAVPEDLPLGASAGTAMAAHPSLPYVVVGHRDDSVTVLAPAPDSQVLPGLDTRTLRTVEDRISEALRASEEEASNIQMQQEEDRDTRGNTFVQPQVRYPPLDDAIEQHIREPVNGTKSMQLGERCSVGPVRTGLATQGPENRLPQFGTLVDSSMKRNFPGAVPVGGSSSAPSRRELSILTNHDAASRPNSNQNTDI